MVNMSTANIQAQLKAFKGLSDIIDAIPLLVKHLRDGTLTPIGAYDDFDLGDDEEAEELKAKSADACTPSEKVYNLFANAHISPKEAICTLLTPYMRNINTKAPLSYALIRCFDDLHGVIFAFHYDRRQRNTSFILIAMNEETMLKDDKSLILKMLCGCDKLIECNSKRGHKYVRINFDRFIIDTKEAPPAAVNIIEHKYNYKAKGDAYRTKMDVREKQLVKAANRYNNQEDFIKMVTIDHVLTFNIIMHITSIIRNTYFYVKHAVTPEQEERYEELRYTIRPTGQIVETRYLYNTIIILDFDIHQAIDEMKFYLQELSEELKDKYADKYKKLCDFFLDDHVIDKVKDYIIDYLERELDNDDHTLPLIVTAHHGLHMWLINDDPSNAYTNATLNSRNRFVNIFAALRAERKMYDIASDITFDSLTEDNFIYLFQLDVFTSNDYGKATAGNILPYTKVKDDPNVSNKDALTYEPYSDKFTLDTPFTLSIQDVIRDCSIFSSYLSDSYLKDTASDTSVTSNNPSTAPMTNDELEQCIKAYNMSFNQSYYNHDKDMKLTNAVINVWNKIIAKHPNKADDALRFHRNFSNRSYVYKKDNKKHNYQHSIMSYTKAIASIDSLHSNIAVAYNDFFMNTNNFSFTDKANQYKSAVTDNITQSITHEVNMEPLIDECLHNLYDDEDEDVANNDNPVTTIDPSLTSGEVIPSNLKYPISMIECVDKELYDDTEDEDMKIIRKFMHAATNGAKQAWNAAKHTYEDKQHEAFIDELRKEVGGAFTIHNITHVSEDTIAHAATKEDKAKLLTDCIRYDPYRGVFYTYTQTDYCICEYKCEDFKNKYLPTLIKDRKDRLKIYDDLMYDVALRGIQHIKLTDIYKHNPLSTVKDESPDTYEQDKIYFMMYFDHVFKYASNDVKAYLLKWIAMLVQHPGLTEPAIIILGGKHGTGKTLFTKLIAFLLYTEHTVNFNVAADQYIESEFTSYSDRLEDHTGRFNGKSSKHLFSGIQELKESDVTTTDAAAITNSLKRLTDPSKGVERKGLDRYEIQNIGQIMICTNNPRKCIQIEYSERRFLPIMVNSEHAKDKKYWAQHYNHFSRPYFIKHIYDYFHNEIDITDFASVNIPTTDLLIDMMLNSLSTLQRFVMVKYEDLINGVTHDEFINLFKSKDDPLLGKYSSAESMYRDYCTTFKCYDSVNRLTGEVKIYPDEDELDDYSHIQERFAEMYENGKIEDQSAVLPLVNRDDEESKSEVDKLKEEISNLVIKLTRRQSSQKGDYLYVLTSDIPAEHKAEVIAQLTEDGWKRDNHLGDKRNARGYKHPVK